ncbi:hypothetical protein ACOME3_008669 [Neoechinorhynchus agilis]
MSFTENCDSIRNARKPILTYWHKKGQIMRSLAKLERPINDQIDKILSERLKTRLHDSTSVDDHSIPSQFDDSDFVDTIVSRHYGSISQLPTLSNSYVQNYLKHKGIHKPKSNRMKTSKGKNVIYKVHPKIAGFCLPKTRRSIRTNNHEFDRKALFESLFNVVTST